jgi:hypothetical protein
MMSIAIGGFLIGCLIGGGVVAVLLLARRGRGLDVGPALKKDRRTRWN